MIEVRICEYKSHKVRQNGYNVVMNVKNTLSKQFLRYKRTNTVDGRILARNLADVVSFRCKNINVNVPMIYECVTVCFQSQSLYTPKAKGNLTDQQIFSEHCRSFVLMVEIICNTNCFYLFVHSNFLGLFILND